MLSLLLAFTASADDKPAPTIKTGGVVFAHYGVDLTAGSNAASAFDLDRAYLTVRADLTEHLATRLTLDADREKPFINTDGTSVTYDTKTRVFVKHAYLEWKDAAPGVKLRFGMADTAWIPVYDQFWAYRFMAKSASDEAGWLSTSDLGVQVMGEHAKGLVGWQASFINGEGYSKPEIDASKTGQARVTVDPLAPGGSMNLPISAFISQSFLGDADTVTMFGGAAGFKQTYLTVWAEYLGRSSAGVSGSIISATVMPKIPKAVTFVGRFDLIDPDSGNPGDSSTKLVVGAGHEFYERVVAAVDYESVTPELGDPTQGLYLRMQAGW